MVNISCDNRKTQDVYDCFISHACEDKDSFVRELALSLQDRGFKVWYDEFTLRLGNSLCNSIDRGIANSTCGIVVLRVRHIFDRNSGYKTNCEIESC